MAKDKRLKFQPNRGKRGDKGRSADLQQKKSLGQVFLKESWPCEKVVETLLQWQVTEVLEIGPGKGALTSLLLKAGFKVTAVEKDERFAEFVREHASQWAKDPNHFSFTVVEADFLEFGLADWLEQSTTPAEKGGRCAIVGNIPYNISTPILLKTFEVLNQTIGAIFLTQLEFAERVAAKAGGKEYGSLSVLCSLHSMPTMIAKVPKEAFTPVPKVDSALITLTPKNPPETPARIRMVESISRRVFQQRRKMLRNSLAAFLGKGATPAPDFPIDLNRRPETLSLQEFTELAEYLAKAPLKN